MTQMWSTTSHVLNANTSLNPPSLCNSFCLPQHFLHRRWGMESWMLLAKLLLLLQTFPLFSPMANGMQKTLGACWYLRFSIDSSTSLNSSPRRNEPQDYAVLPMTALRHIHRIQKTGEYFQHSPIYTSSSSCPGSSGWTNKQLRIFSASGFVWEGTHKKVFQNSTAMRTS